MSLSFTPFFPLLMSHLLKYEVLIQSFWLIGIFTDLFLLYLHYLVSTLHPYLFYIVNRDDMNVCIYLLNTFSSSKCSNVINLWMPHLKLYFMLFSRYGRFVGRHSNDHPVWRNFGFSSCSFPAPLPRMPRTCSAN